MISKQLFKKIFIIILCYFANTYSGEIDNPGALEIVNKTDKDLSYNIFLPSTKFLRTDTIPKQSALVIFLPIVKAKKSNETYVFYLGDFDEDAPTQHFYIRDPKKTAKITIKTEFGKEHICLS